MKLQLLKWEDIINTNSKKVVFWGKGQALKNYIPELEENGVYRKISYIVDNDFGGEVIIGEKRISVYSPNILKKENNVIIVITSTEKLLNIYEELQEMKLDDSFECVFLLFIRFLQPKTILDEAVCLLKDYSNICAPKIIHTFWFSGDPLPEDYKRCLDSWKKNCQNYEIKVWDQDSYNCRKNKFVMEAIKARKWAFAADVARLDVMYEYGGIYMDLDVEIYKTLDDLLWHQGVFFHYGDMIDMPVFASVKGNPILKKIRSLYDNLEFSSDENFQKKVLVQPRFVKQIFETEGVPMKEGAHEIKGNLYLPRNMFLPYYWFDWSGKSKCGDAGYGIHHCNAGWFSDSSKDERNKEAKRIAELWNQLHKEEM